MDSNTLIGLIGGLGIGSLITAVYSQWQTGKKERQARIFQERKEAYIGLLDCLFRSNFDEKAVLETGYWSNRCRLVVSEEQRKEFGRIYDELVRTSSPIGSTLHPDRVSTMQALEKLMRIDLGIIQ